MYFFINPCMYKCIHVCLPLYGSTPMQLAALLACSFRPSSGTVHAFMQSVQVQIDFLLVPTRRGPCSTSVSNKANDVARRPGGQEEGS